MNRRRFAALAVSAIPFAQSMSWFSAQEPSASPYPLVYDGQLVRVDRAFEPGELPLRGIFGTTTVAAVFDTPENAIKGFETAAGIADLFPVDQDRPATPIPAVTPTPDLPEVGDQRAGQSLIVTQSGEDLEVFIFRAVEQKVLHVWVALGFSGIEDQFRQIIEDLMIFEEVDPDDNDAVFGLLPTLSDFPEGWKLTEENIERDF